MLSAASLLSSTTSKRRLALRPSASWVASAIRSPFNSIDIDLSEPARVAGAAKHALRAEFRDDPSAAVDRDDATAAAQLTELAMEQFVYRLAQGESAVLHGRADVVRGNSAYEVFAMAGGRNGTDAILRIGSGPDDRRVADAPLALVRHAAGGGGRGEIAGRIERDRPDRPLRGGDQIRDRAAAALALELRPALLGAEVRVRHE